MATRTISDAGGNWSAAGAWVEGVAPTNADDVIAQADGTSGPITVDTSSCVCKSLDLTNYTGLYTHTTFNTLTVSGSIKLVATMTISMSGTIQMNATGSFWSGGLTLGIVDFNAVGGTFDIQDDVSCSRFEPIAGTLNTNNHAITVSYTFRHNGSSTVVLNLGSSTITSTSGTNAIDFSGTNLTLNAGTSVVILSGSDAELHSTGLTWNEVRFTGAGTPYIVGANTFAILTRTGTAVKNCKFQLQANQTITGTLNLDGNSPGNRVLVYGSPAGTPKTFTCNGTVSASNVNFMDITGAGTASWNLSAITGGSGDCGRNSGITFTTAKTWYWHVDSGNYSDYTKWYDATNGGGNQATYPPLPQDTARFDANSFDSGSKTVTYDMYDVSGFDCTGATHSPTISWNIAVVCYGSIVLITGFTYPNGWQLTMGGDSSVTFTSNGANFGSDVTIDKIGGTLTLSDDFSATVRGLIVTRGTFDANDHNVTASWFRSNNSNTRVIYMGSGTFTVSGYSGYSAWDFGTVTGLTLYSETSTIVIANTSANQRTFAGGGKDYYNLTLNGGTGSMLIQGSNSFGGNFTINAPNTVTFTSTTTQIITGDFNAAGTVANPITINASAAASFATLSKASGTVNVSYCSIQDSHVGGGATWYAYQNCTDVSGNDGWIWSLSLSVTDAGVGADSVLNTPKVSVQEKILNYSVF